MSRALALPLLILLAACDSDKVTWAFVSNPGGTQGNGGVIVIYRSSSASAGLETAVLQLAGEDAHGHLTVLLPHGGDIAVLDRGDRVELCSPALPGDRRELAGATAAVLGSGATCLRLQLPDAMLVHPAMVGPGMLHVASVGTLMVLESASGLVVFGEQPTPEVLPPTVQLTTMPTGDQLALLLPDHRLRALVPPPPPDFRQRCSYESMHGMLRVMGPHGEVVAELPSANVELQPPGGILFLRAELPAGLPRDPTPMTLLMARDNRYLLRVNLE